MIPPTTPYDLPFEAHHSAAPLFAAGGDVRVDVELASPPGNGAVDALNGVIIAFSELASTGALSGETIPPWESRIRRDFVGPSTAALTCTWILRECYMDERALVVLVQLFLDVHGKHPLRRVTLSGGGRLQKLAYDPNLESPYPGVFAKAPFPWEVDEDAMNSPTLFARFAKEPSDAQRKEVSARLLTWAAATAMGAYPVAPVPPSDCGAAVEPDIAFLSDEIEWPFVQFYAHPDSLYGLVNALAAVSALVLSVEAVRVE